MFFSWYQASQFGALLANLVSRVRIPGVLLETGVPTMLHFRKLTWNLKRRSLQTTVLFKGALLGFHVSFRECMDLARCCWRAACRKPKRSGIRTTRKWTSSVARSGKVPAKESQAPYPRVNTGPAVLAVSTGPQSQLIASPVRRGAMLRRATSPVWY